MPKSKTFETLEAIGGQTNQIPVVLGKNMDGHFVYRLTINLPNGYIFEGNQKTRIVLEERIYATAELTPEEQVEDERRKKAKTAPISASPFIPGVVVPTVQASVTSVLEVETSPKQKTLDDTITAWELSLEEKSYSSQFHED